jgi:hypothetical protein
MLDDGALHAAAQRVATSFRAYDAVSAFRVLVERMVAVKTRSSAR